MGGLKKYMPITFATMLTGWLAICGVPIFAGFFSKDEILWKAWSAGGEIEGFGKALWIVGAITALITAVYMTRLMVMTFWGADRFREAHAGGEADEAHAHAYAIGDKPHDAQRASVGDRPHHEPSEHVGTASATHHDELEAHEEHHGLTHGQAPHESPWVMTVPLIVLALLSTFGGLLGVPYALSSLVGGHPHNYFESTLEPAVAHMPETSAHAVGVHNVGEHGKAVEVEGIAPHPVDGAAPLSVGEGTQGEHTAERVPTPKELNDERLFTGISILIALAGIGIGWMLFQTRPLREMPRILEHKYYIDEVYDATIVNPINAGSREGLWKIFDVAVIDGIVNGLGRGVSELGSVARYLQYGFVRGYAAVILLGALAVIGYFAYSGIHSYIR